MSTKKLQILGSLGTKIYTQNEEPTDAPDGALWLDLDEESQSSSGAIQPDWNQTDDTQMDYIKNKPFGYGETYIEDLVLPTPSELYCTILQEENVDTGYALLGYKTIFEAGKTYTLEHTFTDGPYTDTNVTNVTAYPASALGFTGLDDVMVLVDTNSQPHIVSGALVDLSTFPNVDPSTIVVTDDTMYLTCKIKREDMSHTMTCKGYNNIAQGYKTIDVNYLPMQQLNQTFQLKNELIKTEQIADSSISMSHLQESIIDSKHIKDNIIATNHIQQHAVTEDKISVNSITTSKLADFAVTSNKIANGAIQTDKIAVRAITANKLEDDCIERRHFKPGSIPFTIIKDYEIRKLSTVTQDVVSISQNAFYASEGIFIFNIFSTDRLSTSQEIVISLEFTTKSGIVNSNGIPLVEKEEFEIYRGEFDFSGGKSVQFECHILQTNSTFFVGEIRAISEQMSIIKPIMFQEIITNKPMYHKTLPNVKVAFNDSINQQIAVGSTYQFVTQQEQRTFETQEVVEDV